MTKRAVPDFSSLDEMARFFDEKSVADLGLQVEPIKYEPKRIVVSVRFDPDDMVGLAAACSEIWNGPVDTGAILSQAIPSAIRAYTRRGIWSRAPLMS